MEFNNLEEAQKFIQKFCEERDWDQFHSAKDLAIGISTEAGELLDLFRFKTEEQVAGLMSAENRARVEEELSDVFFFVLRFSQLYDIDLFGSLSKKMQKNADKYPVDRAKGSNLKYNERV